MIRLKHAFQTGLQNCKECGIIYTRVGLHT